jgi:hypothetical protein
MTITKSSWIGIPDHKIDVISEKLANSQKNRYKKVPSFNRYKKVPSFNRHTQFLLVKKHQQTDDVIL